MIKLSFEQLLQIYRHVAFEAGTDRALLTIADEQLLDLMKLIDADPDASEEANVSLLVEPAELSVGKVVPVRLSAPRVGLGLLVEDFNALLKAPEAHIAEPRAYFIVQGTIDKGQIPAPSILVTYRLVLRLVHLLADSAAYTDRTRQELVFIQDGKFVIPVMYNTDQLERLQLQSIERILDMFTDEIHRDQKLSLLSETVVRFCDSQSVRSRFAYILNNIEAIADEVRNGYRLFVSDFSYSKIRSDIENAKLDYVNKIHRTFVDVQSQLLGLPIASIVVASQLKTAVGCGAAFWTNIAVLSGALIFVILLLIALANQWVTLNAVSYEISRQRFKLANEYAAISNQFLDVFDGLLGRVLWHKAGLMIIAVIAIAGAAFAAFAFGKVTQADFGACFSGSVETIKLLI